MSVSVEGFENRTSDKLDPGTLRELVGDLGDPNATDRIEALVGMGPSLRIFARGLSLRGRERFPASPGFDF